MWLNMSASWIKNTKQEPKKTPIRRAENENRLGTTNVYGPRILCVFLMTLSTRLSSENENLQHSTPVHGRMETNKNNIQELYRKESQSVDARCTQVYKSGSFKRRISVYRWWLKEKYKNTD